VNEARIHITVHPETLPGKAPENWELPLRFVPAPPNLTVMPVIELTPSPRGSLTPGATTLLETGSGTLIAPVDSSVTVSKVIETSDGYILIGDFQPKVNPENRYRRPALRKLGMQAEKRWPTSIHRTTT